MTSITSASVDFARRSGQPIAARGPARAGDQRGAFELEQDLHQEPCRNAVLVGDAPNMNRLAGIVVGRQLEHGEAGVFGFGGEVHGKKLGAGSAELGVSIHSTLPVPCSAQLNAAAVLFCNRMQAALGFSHAAPAAGTFVGFFGADSSRAGPATDARIALIVQRIIGNAFV